MEHKTNWIGGYPASPDAKPLDKPAEVKAEPLALNTKAYVRWGSIWHVGHVGAEKTFCGRKIGRNPQWNKSKPGGMAHCRMCNDGR